MIQNNNIDNTMLSLLNNRRLSIACMIIYLTEQGYIPNKKKTFNLNVCDALVGVYKNVQAFTPEQMKNFDNLFNKLV